MLKRFYEECCNNFSEFEKLVRECFESVCLNGNSNILENFQNSIIQYGNNLENEWNLKDTEIITELELLCESLYELSVSESENRDNICSKLKEAINRLPAAFANSCKRTDYALSLVLIAKNEEKYISEWIEYHLLAGVDHFYIYDNESGPAFKQELDKYIKKELVTYIYYPGERMQIPAYNHALEKFKYDSQYMAFIDADEFIVAPKHKNILEALNEIFVNYINLPFRSDGRAAGVGINWRMYGSSGNKNKFDGLLMEKLLYRATDYDSQNVLIKTICNPRYVTKFLHNPHSCQYKEGYICISERGSVIQNSYFADGSGELLRINHYYLKSEEDYIEKCQRGWPDYGKLKMNIKAAKDDFEILDKKFNAVKDDIMLQYVDRVKTAMKARG